MCDCATAGEEGLCGKNANFVVNVVAKFPFDKPHTWPAWIQIFEDILRICNVSGHVRSEEEQVTVLVRCMGPKAVDLLATFPDEAWSNFNMAVELFTKHFTSSPKLEAHRAAFNSRRQRTGESIENFFNELKRLVELCGYTDHERADLMRTRIITGLQNKELRERLSLQPNLTIERAITVVKALGVNYTCNNQGESEASYSGRPRPSVRAVPRPAPAPTTGPSCGFCGGPSHPRPTCPASNTVCLLCQKKGHFARMCKTAQNDDNDNDDEDVTSNTSSSSNHSIVKPPRIKSLLVNPVGRPEEQVMGCLFCGGPRKHPKHLCPSANVVCRICKVVGHFPKCCRRRFEVRAPAVKQVLMSERTVSIHDLDPSQIIIRGVNQKLHPGPSSIFLQFVKPDSDAHKAGLRRGDIILKINDVDATNWTSAQASAQLFDSNHPDFTEDVTLTVQPVQRRNIPPTGDRSGHALAAAAGSSRNSANDPVGAAIPPRIERPSPATTHVPLTEGGDAPDDTVVVQDYFILIRDLFDRIPDVNRVEALSATLDLLETFLTIKPKNSINGTNEYLRLLELEGALVNSHEDFECLMCLTEQVPEDGVVLRECLHTFCRACLVRLVETSDNVDVSCPYVGDSYSCGNILSQNEIKAIVPEEIFEKYMERSLSLAEHQSENSYHCKTPDCRGWCIIDPQEEANNFMCQVCGKSNCLSCKAVHDGMTCERFKQLGTVDGAESLNLIGNILDSAQGMPCPKCKVIVLKDGGCDGITCTMCKTEICWATKGPRWGPAGKNDTSGGCRCGVNGRRCTPTCNFCH